MSTPDQHLVVRDVDIPFRKLVWLFLKCAVAALPALLLLALIGVAVVRSGLLPRLAVVMPPVGASTSGIDASAACAEAGAAVVRKSDAQDAFRAAKVIDCRNFVSNAEEGWAEIVVEIECEWRNWDTGLWKPISATSTVRLARTDQGWVVRTIQPTFK